jgi:hypothetical protein
VAETRAVPARSTPKRLAPSLPDRTPWTPERIRALGVTTSLTTAAAALGIGRTLAYRLAATGAFPIPVIRAGNRLLVPVAALLQVLHLDQPREGGRLDPAGHRSVDTTTTPADCPPDGRSADHTR